MHELFVLSGLLIPALLAGTPPPVPRPDAQVILVQIEVAVRDGAGSAIAGLRKERFTVLEFGRKQRISRVEEFPASRVVLVLDTSPSMEPQFWSARRAAWDLLAALGPGSAVAVVGCADGPRLQAGFTRDREEAAASLAVLRLKRRQESAPIACLEAAADLLDAAPGGPGALVLVSDGEDTTLSGEELQGALKRLERRLTRQDLRLDVLGYGRPGWMARLVRSSGGTWRSSRRRGSVPELARLLGHHYELAYYPEDRSRGWRAVAVEVEGEGLDVQAPLGYRLGKAPRRRALD